MRENSCRLFTLRLRRRLSVAFELFKNRNELSSLNFRLARIEGNHGESKKDAASHASLYSGTTFNCHPLGGMYPTFISILWRLWFTIIPEYTFHILCVPFLSHRKTWKNTCFFLQRALHCRLCNPWKFVYFSKLFQWDVLMYTGTAINL